MHISRQTKQELVVVSGTRWVTTICATSALFTLYDVISRHELKVLFLTALLLLFAVGMDLHKTFTFDAIRRSVRWNGRKVFKSESGEIPFHDITDIGTEVQSASSGSGGRQVPIYRLTVITPRATIPMAYTYNGQTDGYSALRVQILGFINGGPAIDSPNRTGLLSDRK